MSEESNSDARFSFLAVFLGTESHVVEEVVVVELVTVIVAFPTVVVVTVDCVIVMLASVAVTVCVIVEFATV